MRSYPAGTTRDETRAPQTGLSEATPPQAGGSEATPPQAGGSEPTALQARGIAVAAVVLAFALAGITAAGPAAAQVAPQSAPPVSWQDSAPEGAAAPRVAEGSTAPGVRASHRPAALELPVLAALDAPGLSAGQQQPRRHTMRGLRIGAITGALAGAGVGTLMALWCAGTSDGCMAAIPLLTVFGAASGAAAGAIIGAAVPTEAGRDDPAQPTSPVPAPGRRIGSFSMSVGDAQATIMDEGEQFTAFDGGGIAFRANVYAELRPWFAIGPDLGVASFGDGGTIRHAAVGVRGTWPVHPSFAPYISANAGAYDSSLPSLEYLGGGLGVGFRVTPVRGSRAFLDLEARSSRNLQNIAPMRMRTISVGGGIYW
jgi:hypothetical protein